MGSTATRERIVDLLTRQLGNPKVREKDRSHLARLLEKNGRPCLDCKGYAEVCSKSMKCRKICPLTLHSCTKHLIPCPACSVTFQLYKPLFYTYDDRPCFNLVSGIMQAREDLWIKNSMRKLQKNVEELKKEGQALREEVKILLKHFKPITPNPSPNYVPHKIPNIDVTTGDKPKIDVTPGDKPKIDVKPGDKPTPGAEEKNSEAGDEVQHATTCSQLPKGSPCSAAKLADLHGKVSTLLTAITKMRKPAITA